YLAGERPFRWRETVLSAERHRGAGKRPAERLEVDERRAQRDVGARRQRRRARDEGARVLTRVFWRLVHLPVGSEQRPSGHALAAARSAATPGNSLPSMYSSVAPPPVEMNVILSAKPSLRAAAAESPPPTTD